MNTKLSIFNIGVAKGGLTMELIDKAELVKYPIRIDHYDKEHGNEHFVLGIESVFEFAEQLPTIDAVEVVRCKDCVWKGIYKSSNGKNYPRCQNPDYGMASGVEIADTDFCSYGRRIGELKMCEMSADEIVRTLRENAEWCDANEYEVPLCMGDNQRAAADLIESLQAQLSTSQRRERAVVELIDEIRNDATGDWSFIMFKIDNWRGRRRADNGTN